MTLTRPTAAGNEPEPDDIILAKARIQLHYIASYGFLGEAELLHGLDALASIPVDIVQGELDTICPPQTAWALAQALPHSRLQIIPQAGHSAFEPAIASALIAALASLPCRH
jgi:proline iminopeptidase